MKFNAYFVQLKHPEDSLTSTLLIADEPVSANFLKIGEDIFIARFKNQVELSYHQKLEFKNRDKEATTLLPVLSQYNKRKLAKLSRLLSQPPTANKLDILVQLTEVDNFLRIDELIDFFSFPREEVVPFLLQKELDQEVKLIDINNLCITSYANFREYTEQLDLIYTECCTSRNKSLKFAEIEDRIKLPQASIFFRYLIRVAAANFTAKVEKDRIMFKQTGLSENDKISLVEIAEILKKDKLVIFSIDNIVKLSHLSPKNVNDKMWSLLENGEAVRLNDEFFIFNEDLTKLINKLKKFKRNQGEWIDIQAFRELTNLTRKYIIALFEYFDVQQITERVDNRRKILLTV